MDLRWCGRGSQVRLEWVIEGSRWLRFCGFFFLPPVGFDLVAKIHLLGFQQGRSATYVYKASHIDAYIIVTLIIPDGLLLHINWK